MQDDGQVCVWVEKTPYIEVVLFDEFRKVKKIGYCMPKPVKQQKSKAPF